MLYGRAAGIEAAEEVGSDLGCLLLTAVELSPAAAGKERREPVERPPPETGRMVPSTDSESPHLLLGRLRFLSEAIGCLIRAEPLPAALGYVPREVQYKLCKDPSAQASASASGRSLLSVWESPSKAAGGTGPGIRKSPGRATIEVRKGSCIRASGEEYCNGHGLWVKLTRVRDKAWLSRAPFGPGG